MDAVGLADSLDGGATATSAGVAQVSVYEEQESRVH